MVSPTTYLIALPLGIVAMASWLVRLEDSSFDATKRTANIQQVARHGGITGYTVTRDTPPIKRMDHGRYGWDQGDGSEGGSTLGNDPPRRTLGTRPGLGQPWLEQQTSTATAAKGPLIEGSAIPGYIPPAGPGNTTFETVPAESGFHITADEATKMDIQAERVVFNGKVKMSCPQFHLSSTQLIVTLGKDKKSFKLAEAKGDVHVQLTGVPDEKKYRGQSGVAVYNPVQETLVMTQWPKIQGQGQELIAAEQGTKVTLFPKTGKMLTEGRAQTRVARQLMADGGPGSGAANPSTSNIGAGNPPRAVPITSGSMSIPVR